MSLKILSASIILVAVFAFSSHCGGEEINIYFKASPRLGLLYPYSDPATLAVLVTGGDGRSVAQGMVTIRLEAPESSRFLSTDFPLVEGSRLLDMSLPLRRGRAEWKYLFPIRGQYRLTVEFTAGDGQKTTKVFPLEIKENKQKWLFLGMFSLGLFGAGVIAGRIFTHPATGEKRRAAACLLLLMSCLPVAVEGTAQELERPYFGRLEVDPATVGKPSKVRWALASEESAARRAVLLNVTITHIEKGKTVFSVERLPVPGEFTMDFQFADGAEYRVAAVAYLAGGQMIRTEQNIVATGMEPPARAIIPAIVFFLALIALGLGVGRWSRRTALSPVGR